MILPNNCCCDCLPLTADGFVNVTTVNGGSAPYARPAFDSLNCDPVDCGDSWSIDGKACYTRGFDNVPLALQQNVTGIDACSGESGAMVSAVIDNCFAATGSKVSFPRTGPRCGMGWKGVQAYAQWPGRYGFVDTPCCITDGVTGVRTPTKQFKYTGITFTQTNDVTTTFTDWVGPGDLVHSYHQSLEQTAVVDDYGNVNRSGHMNSTDVRYGLENITDNCRGATVPRTDATEELLFPFISGPTVFDSVCSAMTWKDMGGTDRNGTLAELNALELYKVNPVDNSSFIITGGCSGMVFTLSDDEITAQCDADMFYGTKDGFGTVIASITLVGHFKQTIKLSGEYTFAAVKADCIALLNEWDLTKDDQYPWRTDAKTWLQPYVDRDAESIVPTINWTVQTDADGNPMPGCPFTNEIYYTGIIRGSPMPAGYGGGASSSSADRFYNFRHINWIRFHPATDPTACVPCAITRGAYAPDEVPRTSTQWTNYQVGSSMMGPGAHVCQILDYNYGPSSPGPTPFNGCFMQKWAETAEPWPSLNFARTCGHDRWLRIETDEFCISSFDGTTLVLSSGSSTLAVNDKIGAPDGVYRIDSVVDPLNYTTTLLYAQNPDVAYTDIKRMRYPSARGICGTMPFTAVQTSPGVITITTARNHWLRVDDTLALTGITGAGTTVVTVPSNLTFTVTGTLVGTAGTATQTGEQTAWDTTCSKHQVVTREWQSQYREADEDPLVPTYVQTLTQLEYAFIGSQSYVYCCSPNGEVFPSGVTYDFGDIEADQCYGEEWHRDFVQAVPDPYWQNVGAPCGVTPWGRDSSPCAGDGDSPYPPLVEPLLVAPVGAPSQPAAFYTACEAGIPGAVGADEASCASEPTPRSTIHNWRAAWLVCSDWKDYANVNCGTPGW